MITIRIHMLFQLAINVILMINLWINVNLFQGYHAEFVVMINARTENMAVIAMKTTIVFLEVVLLLLKELFRISRPILLVHNNTSKNDRYDIFSFWCSMEITID